jgi:hypothetical protein
VATEIPAGYWACACVRRNKDGTLKAIKLHAPVRKKCRVCGCKRPPAKGEVDHENH